MSKTNAVRVDAVAETGDWDALWREASGNIKHWAWKFRERHRQIELDDLVGEASVRFTMCCKTWTKGRPFLPYLKVSVIRHWNLLCDKVEQGKARARADSIPATQLEKFGLPRAGESENLAEEGERGRPIRIGSWEDRGILNSDESDHCEMILSQLPAEDAEALRQYMYAEFDQKHPSGRKIGVRLTEILARARKILDQPAQRMLYS